MDAIVLLKAKPSLEQFNQDEAGAEREKCQLRGAVLTSPQASEEIFVADQESGFYVDVPVKPLSLVRSDVADLQSVPQQSLNNVFSHVLIAAQRGEQPNQSQDPSLDKHQGFLAPRDRSALLRAEGKSADYEEKSFLRQSSFFGLFCALF